MECLQRPELSPGGGQVVLQVVAAQFALLAEQGAEAVEVGHEALHRQLRVDRGLEVEHRRVSVLRDPLEHLVPEEVNNNNILSIKLLTLHTNLLSPQMSG